MKDHAHRPIFSMKEWLTLEQAAKYLGAVMDEELTAADVLRLALDKHMKLSVRFLTLAKVKRGEIVRYPRSEHDSSIAAGILPAKLRWQLLSPKAATSLPGLPKEAEGQYVLVVRDLQVDCDKYVKFTGKIKTIEGVWDLPMIGGEKLDIEERYQQLTNGPQINRLALEGVVIQGPGGELCQLQEQFSFKEYSSKWDSEHRELKQHIAAADIVGDEAERLLNQHKEERKQILKMLKALTEEESYYPARRLPKESNLVIRMDAIIDFENRAKNSRFAPGDPTSDAVETRLILESCKAVNAAMIRRHFKVKTDPDENVKWWKTVMRNASDNGLVSCRVGEGGKGRGSMWRPDLIAGWLVDRHKKGRDGLNEKAAGAALRKFSGCDEAADDFFSPDE